MAGPLVPMQLVAATSIVNLALYGRVSVVSLICEVVVIMLVPLKGGGIGAAGAAMAAPLFSSNMGHAL